MDSITDNIYKKQYEDFLEENKQYYSLYKDEFFHRYTNHPDIVKLRERQIEESREAKRQRAEKESNIGKELDKTRQRSAILASAAGLCTGLCVCSAFFIGAWGIIVCIIGFIIFACCYKGARQEEASTETDCKLYKATSTIDDSWIFLRHDAEVKVRMVELAIKDGLISSPKKEID